MPAQNERLLFRFLSGAKFGDDSSNYVHLDTDGLMQSYGTARYRKSLWLNPMDFYTYGQAPVQAGSLIAASMPIDLSASISGSLWTSCPPIPILGASVASQSGSIYGATAFIHKPQGADTSGSIAPRVHWTMREDLEGGNASATQVMYAAISYLTGLANDACPVRTAACQMFAASYGAAASGQTVTTCLPNLPSWGANDFGAILTVGWNPGAASADGSGSHVGILGVELEYTANKLGSQSAE